MKSLLIIASLDSVHVFNYIKNVIEDNICKYKVTIFNQVAPLSSVKEEYLNYYKSLGINVIGGRKVTEGRFKYTINTYRVLKSLGKFDLVHVHYVSHYLAPVLSLLKNNYKDIILTYWGSDILRSSNITRKLTSHLTKIAKYITFTAPTTFEYFMSFKENYSVRSKCMTFDFGDMFLEYIDSQLDKPQSLRKKEIGLSSDLISIAIGYCGRKEMQQQETIDTLINLPQKYKDLIELVIPTKGMNTQHLDSLKASLDGFKYVIFNDFLGPIEIAKLRTAVDIFIHPQTTDALSNSVIEHIYGGGILLNASWLKYPTFDENGIYYEKFDSFESINERLTYIIDNLEKLKLKNLDNHDKIYKLTSWHYLSPKWLNLYD